MNIHELRRLAQSIPSQGGREIGNWLEIYAGWVPDGSCIVEVGSWLGVGTAHLALGAMQSGAPIHVFDRWICASEEEQEKARIQGVNLKLGEDTLPRVKETLSHFPVDIHYHQGTFKPGHPEKWTGGPISLYIDDLTKTEPIWNHAMSIFKPHFIHGETILILMDYYFFEVSGIKYRAQELWMKEHQNEFESLGGRWAWQTVHAFRYL